MKKKILIIATVVLTCLMTAVTVFATGGDVAAANPFIATFWSLVPPLVAIVLALPCVKNSMASSTRS